MAVQTWPPTEPRDSCGGPRRPWWQQGCLCLSHGSLGLGVLGPEKGDPAPGGHEPLQWPGRAPSAASRLSWVGGWPCGLPVGEKTGAAGATGSSWASACRCRGELVPGTRFFSAAFKKSPVGGHLSPPVQRLSESIGLWGLVKEAASMGGGAQPDARPGVAPLCSQPSHLCQSPFSMRLRLQKGPCGL